MAETPIRRFIAGIVDCSDDLSQSVTTSEDWSRSTSYDSDEQLSSNELSELQKESEMPLEELLCIYGSQTAAPYVGDSKLLTGCPLPVESTNCGSRTFLSSEDEILKKCDLTLDKDEIARDLLLVGVGNGVSAHGQESASVGDVFFARSTPGWQPNNINLHAGHHEFDRRDFISTPCSIVESGECGKMDDLLPSTSHAGQGDEDVDETDDDDDDEEYLPENDSSRHQVVPVGQDHQAFIPDFMCRCRKNFANDNDECVLWDPSRLPETKVAKYCQEVSRFSRLLASPVPQQNLAMSAGDTDSAVDDEQALYLLLQCDYNVHEAVRRHHMQVVPPTDPLSLWSDEERTNFITGLRLYGKDFFLIQQHKVKTRSVGELVQFYYLWKKTDQYAAFAGKSYALRKYTQQPAAARNSSSTDMSVSNQSYPQQQNVPIPSYSPIVDLAAGPFDDIYLHSLPSIHTTPPSWLGSPVYDAGTNTTLQSDPQSFHQYSGGDLLQHDPKIAFPTSSYTENYTNDLYYFPQFCATSPRESCGFERPAKRFCSDSNGSPVVGHAASSGELPAYARAALCFPEDGSAAGYSRNVGQYSLLGHATNNLSNGDATAHGYNNNEMLAQ
jgi:hypothetical protein